MQALPAHVRAWLRSRWLWTVHAFTASMFAIALWLFVDVGKDALKSLLGDAWHAITEQAQFDFSAAARNLGLTLMSAIMLLLLSAIVLRLNPRLIRPRAKAKTGTDLKPRRAVILTMSLINNRTESDLRAILERYRTMEAEDILFDTKEGFFPWQGCLRALNRHFVPNKMVKIFLIYSDEVACSSFYIPLFQEYVQVFAVKKGAEAKVIRAPHCPIDFDDFIACERVTGDLVRMLCIDKGAEFLPRDISIDVTGGTKPTSVAGAIVSMSRDIEFSYVPQSYSRSKPEILAVEAAIDVVTIQQPS